MVNRKHPMNQYMDEVIASEAAHLGSVQLEIKGLTHVEGEVFRLEGVASLDCAQLVESLNDRVQGLGVFEQEEIDILVEGFVRKVERMSFAKTLADRIVRRG